jgi:hypothetical protein
MKSIVRFVFMATVVATTFLVSCVYGQTQTDTTFRTQMNAAFANVDRTRIPYGLLRDYAMEFTNLQNYNGAVPLADTNSVNPDIFWDIYKTVATSRIHSSAAGILLPDTIGNRWFSARGPGRITLAGMFFKYSKYKADAANYVTITNNQIYDKFVSGVWQNPYQTDQVFVISPSVTMYKGKTFQVVLPANLWMTNSASSISNIAINTGSGYVTLTPGVPLNVTYADTSRKEWTYRLTQTDGTILYAHSHVQVKSSPYDPIGGILARLGDSNPDTVRLRATDSYLGEAAIGTVIIRYADADRKVRRPLIVAEGFDPGHITNPELLGGETTVSGFINNVVDSSSALGNILWTNQEYDIIYVDWDKGTDYIQRNAFLLERVIKWVNEIKQPLVNTTTYASNVVVGLSMGGLCARYALKDMENKGINHQTRLFVSFDSPHQGANVPQGIQDLALHAKSLYLKTGATAWVTEFILAVLGKASVYQELNLANTPAAKQMLITHINDLAQIDNSVHNQWQTELKNLGYPVGVSGTPFRMVAVSNGSECGQTQSFLPGANLLTLTGNGSTRFLGEIASSILLPGASGLLGQPAFLLSVLPGNSSFNLDVAIRAQADGSSNEVYKCKLIYTKKLLGFININSIITNQSNSSSASTLPYDYFGGGRYDLKANGFDLQGIAFNNWVGKGSITGTMQPYFCFVPTASALDLGKGNVTLTKSDYLAAYSGATPPASPKNTPFVNFITAFDNQNDQNDVHINIRERNGSWLAKELQGAPVTSGCTLYCTRPTITGPSTGICTNSQTYTVSIPAATGRTFEWIATPATYVNQFQNGSTSNQVTLVRNGGNGTISLVCKIQTECGVIYSNPLSIRVGFPAEPTLANVSLAPYPYYGINATVVTSEVGPYKWYIDGVLKKTTSGTQSDVIPAGQCGVQHYLRVEVSNSCSSTFGAPYYFTNTCNGPGGAFVSPNPASSTLTVSTVTNEPATAAKTSATKNTVNSSIKLIKVYDTGGTLRKTLNFSGTKTQENINVSDLQTGTYFLEILTNFNEVKKQKIIIAR